jgi:hypothetical protein
LCITALLINDKYIFAGTNGRGIFRAKLSDFGITDVKENTTKQVIIIYPNPASDFLYINSSNIIGKEISIYDILGNKLMLVKTESTETRLNVESLPRGVYLIRIGEQTKMFVKE